MVTISIKEQTRRKILSIAGELQRQKGRRVDFDEVIRHLADMYEKGEQKRELFELFCSPVDKGRIRFKDIYATLMKERRMDEQRS
jgi:hypothetical protein